MGYCECGKPLKGLAKLCRACYLRKAIEAAQVLVVCGNLACPKHTLGFLMSRSEFKARNRHKKTGLFFCSNHCKGVVLSAMYGDRVLKKPWVKVARNPIPGDNMP